MNPKNEPVDAKSRLLRVFSGWLVIFLAMLPWATEVFNLLFGPLFAHLPKMIAVNQVSPYLLPVKAVMLISLILTLPIAVYQVLSHVIHGPYEHEKPLFAALGVSSLILFLLGMSVAYFQYFPVMFELRLRGASEGMAVDIEVFFDFVITALVAFGITFQLPVIFTSLFLGGMFSVSALKMTRPYVIIGALIIGAIAFPTTRLALQPALKSVTLLWILFELGVLAVVKLTKSKNSQRQE